LPFASANEIPLGRDWEKAPLTVLTMIRFVFLIIMIFDNHGNPLILKIMLQTITLQS